MKIQVLNMNPTVQEEPKIEEKEIQLPVEEDQVDQEITPGDIDQEIARLSTYEDKELGLEAFYHHIDEQTGEIVYAVVLLDGSQYYASYQSGRPFDNPTYYFDDVIEWRRRYDENGNEVHYSDSTGLVYATIINSDGEFERLYPSTMEDDMVAANEEDYVPAEPTWETDKPYLESLLQDLRTILTNMDGVLQDYIETNGEMVTQIASALESMDSIQDLITVIDDGTNSEE